MTDHKLPAGCGKTGVTPDGDSRLVEAPVGRTGPTGVGREWTVSLPYVEPPLTANQRLHRMRQASITDKVRTDTGWSVKGAKVPKLRRCRVELHWVPPDNRRRDADNPYPTLKAACDGIVDAGVVPDDTPKWMDKLMPVIHAGDRARRGSRMWLVITELTEHNPNGEHTDE